MVNTILPEILIAAALILLMLGACETGYRVGRFRRESRDADPNHATIVGAILGLLALLLGFAFSGATTRFIDRQNIMVNEANTIGTVALRADLMPDPLRADMLASLRGYAADRVALFHEHAAAPAAVIQQRLADHQERMWRAAVAAVRADPTLTAILLPPQNELSDLLAKRNALTHNHLPIPVMVLLGSCAAVAMFCVGHAQGLVGSRKRAAVFALSFLLASSLWITIDLDYARRGLIRISPAPLEAALDALSDSAPK